MHPALLDFQFDYVARTKFLKHQSHNSEHGCSQCLHPGSSFNIHSRNGSSTVHIYLPSKNRQMRTLNQNKFIFNELNVSDDYKHICGIQDESVLFNIDHFNPLKIHPEPMHCVFGGIIIIYYHFKIFH